MTVKVQREDMAVSQFSLVDSDATLVTEMQVLKDNRIAEDLVEQ